MLWPDTRRCTQNNIKQVPNFAALWIAGFVAYGGYQSILYYAMLMAQEIVNLSAGEFFRVTAISEVC